MIPVANPRASYRAHEAEIVRAIRVVLEKGSYIGGEQVTKFEKEFANYIGAKHAIGVNSGTDALIISMRALEIGAGDEVLTIDNTALATVAAILATGATPVLNCIIGPHTKAAIPVHLYGQTAQFYDIGIPIIEDCAQACGGFYNGRRVGRIGLFGCFSFYPTKNLGAIGDGGMIVTSDDKLAKKCRHIREYGWNSDRVPKCIGINSRLDPIQAAVLRVKLKYLDEENIRRGKIAARYITKLIDLPIELPVTDNHCFHLFVIQCKQRDRLIEHLRKRKIQTAIHYPVPVHRQPIYKDLVRGDDPNADRLSRRILSLPMYPELTDTQVDQVIDGVRSFFH